MSGVAGGSHADDFLNLLGTITKDPETYESKLKEFREREQAANDAVQKLNASRSNIATDRKTLKEDQAGHEAQVAAFLEEKTRILKTASKFASKEAELNAREEEIARRENTHEMGVDAHRVHSENLTSSLNDREAEISRREKRCDDLEAQLAAKENSLTNKLAKLQELMK